MEQTTTVAPRRVAWSRPSRRAVLFLAVLAVYVVITLGVIYRSPLLTLDQDVLRLDLRERYPQLWHWFHTYVMLGQRGPATLVALPWFVWRAWKARSARPLIMLGTALLILNLSVGVVKIATGRLGPRATSQVHAVFEGGDIFPSGHVSNAVVLYGVIAILAVNWRRTTALVAAFLAVTIGLTTVYLDTHWLSDVFGGWLAGGLVLIVLPWVMPYSERVYHAVIGFVGRIGSALRSSPPPAHAAPAARRSSRTRPGAAAVGGLRSSRASAVAHGPATERIPERRSDREPAEV